MIILHYIERFVWKYVNNNLEPGYPKYINIYVISAVVIENKLFLSNVSIRYLIDMYTNIYN